MIPNEDFLVVCDCTEPFVRHIRALLKRVAPIIKKMEVQLSDLQIVLFRTPESIRLNRTRLNVSEEQFQDLYAKLLDYEAQQLCAIFSYSRIVGLQECKDEPIDAGSLLEEIAHCKLGIDESPSYFLSPEKFSDKELLKRGIAYALGHYYVFELIQKSGGGKFIRERKIFHKDIQNFIQTQSIEFLREKANFCQILVLPVLELLKLADEKWEKKLSSPLQAFFDQMKNAFDNLEWYEGIRLDLEETYNELLTSNSQGERYETVKNLEYNDLTEMISIIEENLRKLYENYFQIS